jgi:putative hemolysin
MRNKLYILGFALAMSVPIFGCGRTTVEPTIGMANPASAYCQEQGYTLEMRTDASGTYGVCIFPDGSECEEWAFYRGECQPASEQEPPTEPAVEVPDPTSARDAALAYLSTNYGDEAPAQNLTWTEEDVTEEGLVGASTFQYTADDWLVTVSFPVVAPDATIYTVVIANQATGFRWEGEVDAAGQVTELSVVEIPEGWQVYVNDDFGYRFYYPPTATITEQGVAGFPTDELPEGKSADEYIAELEAEYGNKLCVAVSYELGYINISAPPNEEFRYAICGRTGVGVGEMIDKSETVVIAGQTYTATGFEFIGAEEPCTALPCHNETFVLQLTDGTRIEYGAAPAENATYEDYLATTKDVLLQIVASFVPAEATATGQ